MGLLEKLKSALGLDRERRPASTADPDVTVEREPAAGTERAVKGTGTDSAGAADDATGAPRAPTGASESDDADGPPVDEIDGIGPTYAERLADAGIETVADLAESDAETVAEAAETSASRVEDWLEQARRR